LAELFAVLEVIRYPPTLHFHYFHLLWKEANERYNLCFFILGYEIVVIHPKPSNKYITEQVYQHLFSISNIWDDLWQSYPVERVNHFDFLNYIKCKNTENYKQCLKRHKPGFFLTTVRQINLYSKSCDIICSLLKKPSLPQFKCSLTRQWLSFFKWLQKKICILTYKWCWD
jgi:hypothetical protein